MSDDVRDRVERADLAVGVFGGEAERYAHTADAVEEGTMPEEALEVHEQRLPELWEYARESIYEMDDPLGDISDTRDVRRLMDRFAAEGPYEGRHAIKEAYQDAVEQVRSVDDRLTEEYGVCVEDELDYS